MKTIVVIAAILATVTVTSKAAVNNLLERAFNIEGVTYDTLAGDPDNDPAGLNTGGFNLSTGIGTLSYSITGAGPHYVGAFFDHDIDDTDDTFFNELGSAHGVLGAGQSWEIGDPYGDLPAIYDNFKAGTLGNTNAGFGDVSMALAWGFTLGAGESATVSWTLGTTAPASGFYLEQHDSDSDASIFLSSTLRKTGGDVNGVPDAGSTLGLLTCGLACLGGFAHKMRRVVK